MSGPETAGWRGIDVRVGGRHRVVVRLTGIAEVRPRPALARVPGAPGWLLGVGHANGRLLPVTDLAAYLGLEAGGADQVLVVEREGHLIGLAVDAVSGVASYVDAQGEADDSLPAGLAACVAGHALSGERRRPVIDVAALVAQPQLLLECA